MVYKVNQLVKAAKAAGIALEGLEKSSASGWSIFGKPLRTAARTGRTTAKTVRPSAWRRAGQLVSEEGKALWGGDVRNLEKQMDRYQRSLNRLPKKRTLTPAEKALKTKNTRGLNQARSQYPVAQDKMVRARLRAAGLLGLTGGAYMMGRNSGNGGSSPNGEFDPNDLMKQFALKGYLDTLGANNNAVPTPDTLKSLFMNKPYIPQSMWSR